jgi:hypothetical protein
LDLGNRLHGEDCKVGFVLVHFMDLSDALYFGIVRYFTVAGALVLGFKVFHLHESHFWVGFFLHSLKPFAVLITQCLDAAFDHALVVLAFHI